VRDITQDVRIFAITVEDHDVVVDVYGGPENACGVVTFTFEDLRQLAARVAAFELWCDEQTPVTVVIDDESVAIIDDPSVVQHLLDPA
jgi:hypothetical protein